MKVKITVEIGESQKKLLQFMAKKYETTVDSLVREAIYEYYDDERRWFGFDKGADDEV